MKKIIIIISIAAVALGFAIWGFVSLKSKTISKQSDIYSSFPEVPVSIIQINNPKGLTEALLYNNNYWQDLCHLEELKTLKRFKPGMKWVKAGGTQAVYNDADDFDYTDQASGKTVHISKNVSIIPSTYVMTHSRDYALLLSQIQLYSEFRKERE